MVGISDDFLEQLFLMSSDFSEGYYGTTEMFLGIFSGLRSASLFAAAGGFSLGLNLVGRRGVHAISEDAGGENLLDEAYAKSCKGAVRSMAMLPMSMFLESGNVRYHQFRLHNLPQVLSMSKLGDASSMAQFVVDIPLQLIEVREKQSNKNIDRKAARLMEGDIGAAVLLLQAKILCVYFQWERSTLRFPEPKPPL